MLTCIATSAYHVYLFALHVYAGVFGFTFIETYGVCFPLLIVAMIPFR